MTGVWTPQWLYQHVTLPGSATIRIEPSAFKNDTPWPILLKWLSVAGKANVTGDPDYPERTGGIARRLRFEISLTQKGDINYVPANTQTMFCAHQDSSPSYVVKYDFNPSFPLGPDEGIVVELAHMEASESGFNPTINPSVVFGGLREERNFGPQKVPAMLAAGYKGTLEYNQSVVLDTNDLFNNGEEPLWLRWAALRALVTVDNGMSLAGLGVKLNPTSGLRWLPQNDFIPAGNLFPLQIYSLDRSDEGPNVYRFPYTTKLLPRQRVGIEITNLSTLEQKFGLCLHGLLEVR